MTASPNIMHFISCVVVSWFLVVNVYSAPKGRARRGKVGLFFIVFLNNFE
jgi:hypothetical protein